MFIDDKVENNYNSFHRENNKVKLNNVISFPVTSNDNFLSNSYKFNNPSTYTNINKFKKIYKYMSDTRKNNK